MARSDVAEVVAGLARDAGGVFRRRDALVAGVTESQLRAQIKAGRWHSAGTHTIALAPTSQLGLDARHWQAVWESGSGAVLDGVSALQAAGLTGFDPDGIDVCVPRESRPRPTAGVRIRRRRAVGPVVAAGVPRVRPAAAALHAAEWARSDRQAALLVCLVVQQRLVRPVDLQAAWREVSRSRRRRFLDLVIADVCDGAQSLGELDFARLCRRRGLPAPNRQMVRRGPNGRIYLDAEWDRQRLVVEIDGAQHGWGLAALQDAVRANHVTLRGRRVLRIPVLGLRLDEDTFMGQVAAGLGVGVMQISRQGAVSA